jgi:glycosyltransferase involved in cell wall biosynthesis
MQERVYWGGQVTQSNLPGFYRASDLYISASHSDGSSVSLMEALACGLPVLLSDIPANREWVTSGEQGWLFSDGDWQALAAIIVTAARHRSQLAAKAEAARKLAEQRADWSKNFEKLLRAYEMALQPEASR